MTSSLTSNGNAFLAAALLASLGANAYLYFTRSAPPTSAADTTPVSPTPSSQPRVELTGAAKNPEPPRLVPRDIAALDRNALEKRLSDTEAKIEKLLPPSEKFGRGDRTPENEERIKPFLDKVFHVKPGQEAPYELVCHGSVCRLTTDVSPMEWQKEFQTDPDGVGLFYGKEFGPDGVTLDLEEPGRAAGIHFLVKLRMALRASPRVAQCKAENPTPGDVRFELTLDATTHRLSISTTGSLAGQAAGVCIRRVLDDLVASTPVPTEVTELPDWQIGIKVP